MEESRAERVEQTTQEWKRDYPKKALDKLPATETFSCRYVYTTWSKVYSCSCTGSPSTTNRW